MSRNKKTKMEATGPSGAMGAPEAGLTRRSYRCTTKSGRYRSFGVQNVVKELMRENTLMFQCLNPVITGSTSYKYQGSLPLNLRVSAASPANPRTYTYPIYVFRLNVPNGNQTLAEDQPIVQPLIGYRLQAKYESALAPDWTYNWVPITIPAGVGLSTNNVAKDVMYEGVVEMKATKIFHETSKIDVLLTAPKLAVADVEVSIVKFNEASFAPPDLYLDDVNAIQVFRNNSGYAPFGTPSEADENSSNAYYSNWLHNATSHPLAIQPITRDLSGPKPFSKLQSWKYTLCARTTTSADLAPVQHRHTHQLKAYTWHNTASIEGDRNAVPPEPVTQVQPIERGRTVGVFPRPEEQRWVMVSGWTKEFAPTATTPVPDYEPSFDIRITSKFTHANVDLF